MMNKQFYGENAGIAVRSERIDEIRNLIAKVVSYNFKELVYGLE